MNRFENQFKSSPVHQYLEKMKENSDSLLNFDIKDKNITYEIRRIKKLYNYFKEIINSLDPELIYFNPLNSFSNTLNQGNSQLVQYISTKNSIYLQNANNSFTTCLAYLPQLEIPRTKGKLKGIQNISKVLSEQSNEIIEYSTNSIKELSENKSELSRDVNTLKKQIESQLERTDKLISDFNEKFNSKQEYHGKEFLTTLKKIEEKNKEVLDDLKASYKTIEKNIEINFNSKIDNLEDKSKNIIKLLNEKLNESKKILNITANVAQTGKFAEYAIQENKEYKTFSRIGIILMIIAVILFGSLIGLSTFF